MPLAGSGSQFAPTPSVPCYTIPWRRGHKALCCESEGNIEFEVLAGLVSEKVFGGLVLLERDGFLVVW